MNAGLLTTAERKKLGRFDTPRPLAQALADWAIQSSTDRVLEPSCGGGVIVKSVISRLLELGTAAPEKQIWACDIDPRALKQTANFVLPHSLRLIEGNFLALESQHLDHKTFDVILGNPPYVRLHTMETTDRIAARKILPPDYTLDAKASLWAYFPLHAYKALNAEGRMGWILPETLLHASYGRQILNWSIQNFSRCVAVSLRERCFETEGTKERVVVLLLSGAGGKAARGVEMIEFASAQECVNAIPKLASLNSKVFPQLNGHAVPHLVSSLATTAAQDLEEAKEFKRFGDFVDVKIGVVTGDNEFFVLSDQQRLKARLAKSHFERVVGKFVDVGNGFVVPKGGPEDAAGETKSWLLCPNPTSQDKKLKRYLNKYSRASIEENRTMAKRSHWQLPLIGVTPDAFFRYMGKNGPRMVLNRAGWRCTNTVHAVYFKKGTSAAAKRAICLSLHSSYSQLYAEFEGRQYGSGVLKFEPGESKRLLLAFNPRLVKALGKLWTELSLRRKDMDWENVVPHIDEAIVKHCPKLAKKLPLDQVRTLLAKVRRRRSSIYLANGI